MDMRSTETVDMTTPPSSASAQHWVSHKLQCTADEAVKTACLNLGECFVTPEPNGYRKPSCMCPSDWTGVRCEESYIDLTSLFNKSAHSCFGTTVIGVMAAVCLLLLILVIVMFIIIMKQRRKCAYSDSLQKKKQPLDHQISYSNYHGVRVIHDDKQQLPSNCVIPIPQEHGGFTTFVNQNQEAMSDYGSHSGIDEVDTETECGNHNNKQAVNNTSKSVTKKT